MPLAGLLSGRFRSLVLRIRRRILAANLAGGLTPLQPLITVPRHWLRGELPQGPGLSAQPVRGAFFALQTAAASGVRAAAFCCEVAFATEKHFTISGSRLPGSGWIIVAYKLLW